MMIPDEYMELMNGRIDGVLDDEQQAELDRYLAEHPEAGRYFRELNEATGVFAKVGPLQLPPGLHDRILAAVADIDDVQPADDLGHLRSTTDEGGLFPSHTAAPVSLLTALRTGLRPSHAFALAAGLILGIVAYSWLAPRLSGGDRAGFERFYGAHLPPDLLESSRALDAISLDSDSVDGEIRPHLMENSVLIQLNIASRRSVTLVLDFDQPTICAGFRFGDHDGYRISSEPGKVTIEGNGTCGGEILFDGFAPGAVPLRLILSADNSVLVDRIIPPASSY